MVDDTARGADAARSARWVVLSAGSASTPVMRFAPHPAGATTIAGERVMFYSLPCAGRTAIGRTDPTPARTQR